MGCLSGCQSLASAQLDAGSDMDQQIAALAEAPAMRSAERALTSQREWVNEQMVTINEIAAPPFAEQERAEDYVARLRATSVDSVRIDSTGNVIGLRKGSVGRRTIAVVAHLDTVFPAGTDVAVRREGRKFSAPGIGDNSRGAAMLLTLSAAIDKAGLRFKDDLLLIGSIGEEGLGDLRGVRAIFADDALNIDALIAIDGGHPSRIVTTAVGSHRYRVTVRGPGGHSYGQFGRANPHHALAAAIAEFELQARKITDSDGAKATFSVGRIGGGTSVNSIPFESWMEVDMRSADQDRLDQLDAALHRSVDVAITAANSDRDRGSALTVTLESVGKRPAGQQDVTLPLIQRAIAAQKWLGLQPVLTASSTDANIPISLGIPAITISRGGLSRNAHALNESWEDHDALLSEWFALLLIAAEAGLAN